MPRSCAARGAVRCHARHSAPVESGYHPPLAVRVEGRGAGQGPHPSPPSPARDSGASVVRQPHTTEIDRIPAGIGFAHDLLCSSVYSALRTTAWARWLLALWRVPRASARAAWRSCCRWPTPRVTVVELRMRIADCIVGAHTNYWPSRLALLTRAEPMPNCAGSKSSSEQRLAGPPAVLDKLVRLVVSPRAHACR